MWLMQVFIISNPEPQVKPGAQPCQRRPLTELEMLVKQWAEIYKCDSHKFAFFQVQYKLQKVSKIVLGPL